MELSNKRSRKRNVSPKTSRRVRQETEVEKKEKQLSSLIFGDKEERKNHASDQGGKFDSSDDRFEEEVSSDVVPWRDLDTSMLTISNDSADRLKKLRDSRDETKWQSNELEIRLRKRYEKTALRVSRTKWASVHRKSEVVDLADEDSEKNESDFQQESGMVFATTSNQLPPNVIDMVRVKDVNATDPCGAVLRSVTFHPTSDPATPLLMCAGLDKCLRFYSIGHDEESRKVHGIHCKFISIENSEHAFNYSHYCSVPKLPIYKASFLPESNSVVATGRRSFFYTYDMVAGKVDLISGVLGREEKSWESHYVSRDGKKIAFLGNDGYVVLIDPRNKQATGALKLNGSVRSVAFTEDGRHLLASGSDGDISRYVL